MASGQNSGVGGGDVVLESLYRRAEGDRPARYSLRLSNLTATAIESFRLAFSGMARISADARISGARVVRQLSNYAELAPEPAAPLAPGETLVIDIEGLDYPLRHWTDGPGGAFLIAAGETAIPVHVLPARVLGEEMPLRRGPMPLRPQEDPAVPLAVLPAPNEVDWHGRRTPPAGFAVTGDETVAAAFSALTQTLFPGEGLARGENEGGYPVRLGLVRGGGGSEAYELTWDAEGASIASAGRAGLLYGLVTLAQMQRGARLEPMRFRFPAEGRIADAPAFGWRGCHLDVARRFYAPAEIRRFLAVLAWNKVNVFHWHLSDDEAWRVEIGAYPQLARVGGWRGHGLPIPPLLGTGPERTGGVYSQAAVREIVAWGESLGITVVPEIDIPGHSHALLAALPELRDAGENAVYQSVQSFPNNCLNPGVEAVYPAIETILGELCALFPGRYFHVGADEVPATAWQGSAAAAALSARLGTSGTGPLQAHFLRHVQAFLKRAGKITGAWEEAADGGGIGREDSYLVGWRTPEASRRLAAEGYPVVVAAAQAYYLDMANGPEWQEPGAGWVGFSSPETTFRFDPAAGWSADEKGRLMGVQGCIWSEPIRHPGAFDRLVFPRLSAIAATGWRGTAGTDWTGFAAAAALMPTQYGTQEETFGP